MIWRQQKYPNSCMPCTLSMLLSFQNIDANLIILNKLCHFSFMLEFNTSESSFEAGFLVNQNLDNYQNACSFYGYDFKEFSTNNLSSFMQKIEDLLANNQALILSLASNILPYNKDKHNISSGHAVLIYNKQGNSYGILDPDGGLDRNKDFSFDDVQNDVAYLLTSEELQKALILKNPNKFLLAYLIENSQAQKGLNKNKIIKNSLLALNNLITLLDNGLSINFTTYKDFYAFSYKIIKPFVNDFSACLDLYISGLDVLSDENIIELHTLLKQIKVDTFNYLNDYKTKMPINKDFLTEYYSEKLMLMHRLIIIFLETAE